MGKQISFFMTRDDERDFLTEIGWIAPVRVLLRSFADHSQMDLPSVEGGVCPAITPYLCLVNATFESALKINSYPAQSRHTIDIHESEVVEFHRCEPYKTWLKVGRLWFDERTPEGRKSTAFLNWANSLLKWIRSHYQKDASGLYYVAPHAHELSKAGRLQLGPPTEPSLSLEARRRLLGHE